MKNQHEDYEPFSNFDQKVRKSSFSGRDSNPDRKFENLLKMTNSGEYRSKSILVT